MEGGAEGEHLGPASLAAGGEGTLLTGRPKSASEKGRAGMPTLRSSVEGWGILCPIPTKNLRSLIHLLKERLGGHKWGRVPEHLALLRINRPDLMWPA